MWGISSAILFLVVFTASSVSVLASEVNTYHVNGNMSCSPYETECSLGCCPFAEGVCCADGFECCPHGKTCIPFVGICVGIESEENSKPYLVSTKAAPIRNKVTACPAGTTACGQEMCCPLPNAVCCSDGFHCCPRGYRCDLPHQKCVKDSNEVDKPFTFVDAFQTANKPAYKSCPGGTRQCPSYTSCCLNDSGSWSCCPNPSLNMYRKNNGDCCDTIFGHMCCPDDFPVCTIFGCTNS